MANEITISVNLSYTNAGSNIAADAIIAAFQVSINVAPGAYMRNTQQATGTKTALATPLIGALGYMVLHNCDAVNAIKVFHASGASQAALLLNPGEWQIVRWASGTAPQISNSGSGSPLLEYYAINN